MHPCSRFWRWLGRLLVLGFFVALAVLLAQRAREMDWAQVLHALRAYPVSQLGAALGFSLLSYLAFGAYDLLARWHLRHGIAPWRVMLIAMTAYALNLNLGALMGGWATRLRLYTRSGLPATTTAQIIGLGIASNWSGYLLLAGLLLSTAPPVFPASWSAAPSSQFLRITGAVLLALVASYLLVCARMPGRRWRFRRLQWEMPTLAFASAQLALASVHWLAMCMVLHSLMPSGLGFGSVLAVLLTASVAGAAMHVPAGLGVIEAVVIAMLGDRYADTRLLAALLAYRATFYLVPLLLALPSFALLEAGARQRGASSLPPLAGTAAAGRVERRPT